MKFNKNRKKKCVLCLESGIKGWELIEYKELYWSASEYLETESTIKIEIDKSGNYINQVKKAIQLNSPTHYIYDARTGDQHWLKGLFQSFKIAILFQINGIVPICILTDLPIRTWRTQCGVVSAKRGIVVSLMSPKDISPIFPHSRIIGPLIMPFSRKSGLMLESLINKNILEPKNGVVFTGSLYEPRTSILNSINEKLKLNGYQIEMKGRDLGTIKFSDENYWSKLVESKIVITTSNQITSEETDWTHLPHLIYRYLEVPASGSLLIAPMVPAIERYLKPGVHFVSFENVDDAAKKIEYYLKNDFERNQIAVNGHRKALSLINSNFYWASVDMALGKYSML